MLRVIRYLLLRDGRIIWQAPEIHLEDGRILVLDYD